MLRSKVLSSFLKCDHVPWCGWSLHMIKKFLPLLPSDNYCIMLKVSNPIPPCLLLICLRLGDWALQGHQEDVHRTHPSAMLNKSKTVISSIYLKLGTALQSSDRCLGRLLRWSIASHAQVASCSYHNDLLVRGPTASPSIPQDCQSASWGKLSEQVVLFRSAWQIPNTTCWFLQYSLLASRPNSSSRALMNSTNLWCLILAKQIS